MKAKLMVALTCFFFTKSSEIWLWLRVQVADRQIAGVYTYLRGIAPLMVCVVYYLGISRDPILRAWCT